MMRVGIFFGITAIGLSGAVMSEASGASRPTVTCKADSGKAFLPALTPREICDRFKRTLGDKVGTLRVELRFSAKGMASARTSQLRNGQWKSYPLFEMAVMGRHFNTSDIDRLAGDVIRGVTASKK